VTDQATVSVGEGFAPCEKPARYIQQLVSHWSHKMAATYDDGHALFPFSDTTEATMDVRDDGIGITLTTPDHDENVRMRGVLERHLDRFAFREAPLTFTWTDQ
jgi:uncharacterized protein